MAKVNYRIASNHLRLDAGAVIKMPESVALYNPAAEVHPGSLHSPDLLQ